MDGWRSSTWGEEISLEYGAYADVPGFCKTATLEEVRGHNHVLTPGRYVGAANLEDDEVSFEVRFAGLRATLDAQFSAGDDIRRAISCGLSRLFRAS